MERCFLVPALSDISIPLACLHYAAFLGTELRQQVLLGLPWLEVALPLARFSARQRPETVSARGVCGRTLFASGLVTGAAHSNRKRAPARRRQSGASGDGAFYKNGRDHRINFWSTYRVSLNCRAIEHGKRTGGVLKWNASPLSVTRRPPPPPPFPRSPTNRLSEPFVY